MLHAAYEVKTAIYMGAIMLLFSLSSPTRPQKALLIFLFPTVNLFWGIACILGLLHKGRISRFPQGKHFCKSHLNFLRFSSGILLSRSQFQHFSDTLDMIFIFCPNFLGVFFFFFFCGSIGQPYLNLLYHNI